MTDWVHKILPEPLENPTMRVLSLGVEFNRKEKTSYD